MICAAWRSEDEKNIDIAVNKVKPGSKQLMSSSGNSMAGWGHLLVCLHATWSRGLPTHRELNHMGEQM